MRDFSKSRFFYFWPHFFVQIGPLLSKDGRGQVDLLRRMEVFFMFYLKVSLADGIQIQAEVRGDNVFTHCSCCGNEMPVDLADVFADGEGDLESTELLCPECATLLLERMRES